MELFERIRREYEFGIGTIAGAAKKLGVHRRMVREAIGSALPQPRKKGLLPNSTAMPTARRVSLIIGKCADILPQACMLPVDRWEA